MNCSRIFFWLLASGLAATCFAQQGLPDKAAVKQFIESNCLDCHDQGTKTGGLALDNLLVSEVDRNPEAWEKVIRKLSARQMPPKDSKRPAEREYDAAVAHLALSLDRAAI